MAGNVNGGSIGILAKKGTGTPLLYEHLRKNFPDHEEFLVFSHCPRDRDVNLGNIFAFSYINLPLRYR